MNESVLNFIRGDEPRTSGELWADIERLRAAGAKLDDLPPTVGELTNALFGLMMHKLAEERGGKWYVIPQRAKPAPKQLF